MTREDWDLAMRVIGADTGRAFRVTFLRRRPGKNGEPAGTLRTMVCRLHVTKGVKGVKSNAKEDLDSNTVTVYELAGTRSGFKRIPLDGIQTIKANKKPAAGSGDDFDRAGLIRELRKRADGHR